MDKFIERSIKSILLALIFHGIIILLGTFFLQSFMGDDVILVGITIASTIFFCTYSIIDTIKECYGK